MLLQHVDTNNITYLRATVWKIYALARSKIRQLVYQRGASSTFEASEYTYIVVGTTMTDQCIANLILLSNDENRSEYKPAERTSESETLQDL
jgi:hypothetical protein